MANASSFVEEGRHSYVASGRREERHHSSRRRRRRSRSIVDEHDGDDGGRREVPHRRRRRRRHHSSADEEDEDQADGEREQQHRPLTSVTPHGVRMVPPKMPKDVEQALHELVYICETSDSKIAAVVKQLREDDTLLAEAVKKIEEDVEELEQQLEEEVENRCDPSGNLFEKAVSKLEACQAARLEATEMLLKKKNDLQKAQDAVALAEQVEKTRQCDVCQALAEVVKCARLEKASDERGARWQQEAVTIWRRAAESIGSEARRQEKRQINLLRILTGPKKVQCASLSKDDEEKQEALVAAAESSGNRHQGDDSKRRERLIPLSEKVLSYLVEQQERRTELLQSVRTLVPSRVFRENVTR